MLLWTMLGLARAGEVWLQVDDGERHLEIPGSWLRSEEGGATFPTEDGPVAIGTEVARLERLPEGTKSQWRTKQGLLTLEHRPIAEGAVRDIELRVGEGLALTLALGDDSARLAASSIDADLEIDGVEVRIREDDLLGPLRRARPTLLYRGVTKKGKPVRVELK